MAPTVLFLIQLSVVLIAARLCSFALSWMRQPPVVGEMLAGLLLGPIVFGAWLPDLHGALFAPASLQALSGLATLGVTLFMFIVGVELRAPHGDRKQLGAALAVGVPGIVLPLGLGLTIAPVLHPVFAPEGVGFWPFALFIAAAISVTAFPVLARILKDNALAHSTPGRLAMGAAAIDDASVWIFLAAVLALTGKGRGEDVLLPAVGALALVAIVFVVLKPLCARLLRSVKDETSLSAATFVWLIVGVLACAAFADWVGLHAIFGAFLFGLAVPRDDRVLHALARRIEPVAILILMPVLFTMVGQSTTPEALSGAGFGLFGLILAVAVVGKIGGCAAGARLIGNSWRDSFAVGALMNARGLMELVVIKIGLDAGLIGPELFTLLFGMTLATTLMAAPLLRYLHRYETPESGRTVAQMRSME